MGKKTGIIDVLDKMLKKFCFVWILGINKIK